jgi:hypothetical protein
MTVQLGLEISCLFGLWAYNGRVGLVLVFLAGGCDLNKT